MKYYPVVLLSLMLACVTYYIVVVKSLAPPPMEYNLAVGVAHFNSPEISSSKEFELSIPDPSDELLFDGLFKGASERPAASVRCEYEITDRHRINDRQHLGKIDDSKFSKGGVDVSISFQMKLIREFPVWQDEIGFYYGGEPDETYSYVIHRFSSVKYAQLSDESTDYFISILSVAAHDQRRTFLDEGVIAIGSSGN